jgi:uncharacterized protein YllA (UPF0747 family)
VSGNSRLENELANERRRRSAAEDALDEALREFSNEVGHHALLKARVARLEEALDVVAQEIASAMTSLSTGPAQDGYAYSCLTAAANVSRAALASGSEGGDG